MSSLSSNLKHVSTSHQQAAVYEHRATSPTHALQALIHIATHDYYVHEKTFTYLYVLWSKKLTTHQLIRLYQIASKQGVELTTVLHDIQAPQFWTLVQEHSCSLDHVVSDNRFRALSYFVKTCKPLIDRAITQQQGFEAYLQISLTYHQKDLSRESHTILQKAQQSGYTKQKLIDMQPVKHTLMIEDGAVSLENKDEVALYQDRNDYLLYQAISTTPYFLYVGDEDRSTFIGTHRYKQAIISYTSEKARLLRFEESKNTSADLLIQEGKYKKIYIRGSDEDHKRRYHTDNDYSAHTPDYTVNSFFESESGLSEISHLMTSHQDLIFRSPTRGTALVEGVSGSGKTNLIFHRIDYLLQERSDEFQADHIGVFTPNAILAAYMQAALDTTSFTFRESIQIQSFEALHHLPHPSESTYLHTYQDSIDKQLSLITETVQKRFSTTYQSVISTILESIQLAQDALETLYTSLGRLEQHVHRQGYITDSRLLLDAQTLLRKTTTNHSPPCDQISALHHTIQSSFYTTYTTERDSMHIKQWYYDEIFDALMQQIDTHITSYQQDFVSSWIQNETIAGDHYTAQFNTIVKRLHPSEQTLLQALIATTIRQCTGELLPYRSFQYVLIDEFQDFHPLALQLIHKLYGTSMILSGDFMQSAWYHDIEDLSALGIALIDHRTMRDNFRNTLETLQYAHSVFGNEAGSFFLAKRVIKRGPPPSFITDASTAYLAQYIHTLAKSIAPKETIAIIYYDKEFATSLYIKYINTYDQQILFPSLDDAHYQELITGYYSRQIYCISYRESKGLEFDHVLLIDQQALLESNLHYKKKLWYIGCTRAVKTLRVVS